MMKISKSCEVRFRPDGIYVFKYSNTPYGMFASPPFEKLQTDTDHVVLGNIVINLLQSIPDKAIDLDLRGWRNDYKEHLKSLGFKTDSAFAKGAVSLSVGVEDQKLAITPYKLKSGEGFIPMDDQKVRVLMDPNELGAAVFRCKDSLAR